MLTGNSNSIKRCNKTPPLWRIVFKVVICIYSYGIYCDKRNNWSNNCKDYKFRLCCAKKYGRYTPWSMWSSCAVESVVKLTGSKPCGPGNELMIIVS